MTPQEELNRLQEQWNRDFEARRLLISRHYNVPLTAVQCVTNCDFDVEFDGFYIEAVLHEDSHTITLEAIYSKEELAVWAAQDAEEKLKR